MSKKHIIILLISLFKIISSQEKAVVIKPIIDLLPTQMTYIFDSTDHYSKIGLSPALSNNLKCCARVHQALFHEIINIIRTEEKEVLVELPFIFYQLPNNPKKNNSFWTLKENLKLLRDIKDKEKLPINDFLTLAFPFTDSQGQKYSVGTKFTYQILDNSHYLIYLYDSKAECFKEEVIEKKYCITSQYNNHLPFDKKRSNFIKILKKWANPKNGFIPYVWGGTSFCDLCYDTEFEKYESNYNGSKITYFKYPHYNKSVKSGFDCSGLIMRATQIVGIYFPYKNTSTIAQNLKILTANDQIVNGDLIFIPGHIIVTSDIDHNLCIESRGYTDNGNGRVQEISLNKLFQGINNFEELKEAFFNKKALKRLDRNGNIFQVIPSYKILKLG